jgi:PAS domain-containing protein
MSESQSLLQWQVSRLTDQPLARQLLDAMPGVVLVLTPEGRVVYANQSTLEMLGREDVGRGRGLGTYSMRLLSQRYLKGDVTFTSSDEKETTFRASYPQRLLIEGQEMGSEDPA